MELTLQERQLVERLRRQEQSWRSGRWILLAMGAVSLGLSAAGTVMLIPFLQRAASDSKDESAIAAAFMLALLNPFKLAFAGVAIVAFYWSIRDWRGNAQSRLLLRLAGGQQEHGDQGRC